MIGQPFNPDNCAFVSNQALNSNQFNGNVPDVSNSSVHVLMWDFVEEKLLWVNKITQLIERELPDSLGGQNEEYEVRSAGNYFLEAELIVYGDNYLILPMGTYMFDLEYQYVCGQQAGPNFGVSLFQIRTNTDVSLVNVDASDVVVKQRETKAAAGAQFGFSIDINQTIKTEAVTFTTPFIVKSAAAIPFGEQKINSFKLRAFKIK